MDILRFNKNIKPVFIVGLTILTFLTFSCYTQKIVKLDEIKNNRGKVLAVVTITDDWIEFPTRGRIALGFNYVLKKI